MVALDLVIFLSGSVGLSYFIMHFRAHYNVFMKAIEVDNEVLNLPTDVFDTDLRKGTIIDSGTTLAYFPDVIYEPLISKVHYKNICYCLLFIVFFEKTILEVCASELKRYLLC